MALGPESLRLRIKQLLEKPGNGNCADCKAADPEWASYTLGVLVCHICSGLHRNIPQISKVKSLLLDPWNSSELEFIDSIGNNAAKAKYENIVPAFYYCPTYRDCLLLKEQWIRAKYERKEFMCVDRQEAYSAGKNERCSFAGECTNVGHNRAPKNRMNEDIFWNKSSNCLNFVVGIRFYHNEIVDWFNAIRAARFHYLQVAFPGASDSELIPKATRNFIKEGYMEKTGPKHTEGFKKRWFSMDDRRLMYFKDPLDAFARGEVFIGSKENSYSVLPGLPAGIQGNHWLYGITIKTPDRSFLFACETEKDQKDWMAALQLVINRPMLPQEYAVEAYFKHKP
uniref:ArfGAP with dual PH domains 1 n=1 Tax=Oryzias latipes TaxID=8090 RepID=A0A3P9MLZ2_ORYLA